VQSFAKSKNHFSQQEGLFVMPDYSLYGGSWIEANYVSTGGALGTPSSGTLTNCTFPTLNQSTSGTAAGLSVTLVVGSGGTGVTSLTGLVKGNGTSAMTAAVAGTDYITPTGAEAISGKTSIASTGAVTGSTLVSSVATGTAPLTVASTTMVSNLNAQYVGSLAVSQSASATTIAGRTDQGNLRALSFIPGFQVQVTSAGTLTLAANNNSVWEFTGSSTHTVVFPTTNIVAGHRMTMINNSTGAVTVQSSAGNTIVVLAGGTEETFTALVATPTTAAHWDREHAGLTSPALTTPTLSTATPASAGATGTTGTIVWDADYIYICTATNTWKRAAIASW